MLKAQKYFHGLLCIAILISPATSHCKAGDGFKWLRKTPTSTLEKLAIEVDRLEHELHKDGTVVVKAPDIWGESRLIKHRQEFERIMESKLDDFELLINASIKRSDQTYLANAFALTAAFGEGDLATANPNDNFAFVSNLTTGEIAANADATNPPSVPITRSQINQLDAGTAGFTPHGFDGSGLAIGLEPTIQLDQLKRYLDHLHEIRRVNEGDDTADSAGYSLNLVRIPVSILPGEKTRKGYGAEVTVTAQPHITPELLPRVFRELVINDLVDVLAPTIVATAEGIDNVAFEFDECHQPTGRLKELWRNSEEPARLASIIRLVEDFQIAEVTSVADPLASISPVMPKTQEVYFQAPPDPYLQRIEDQVRRLNSGLVEELNAARSEQFSQSAPGIPSSIPAVPSDSNAQMLKGEYAATELATSFSSRAFRVGGMNLSSTLSSRNARQPFAPSQAVGILGKKQIVAVAYEFWKATSNKPYGRHLVDARSFLAEQLQGGYDYLLHHKNVDHWNLLLDSDPARVGIFTAVRTDNEIRLNELRNQVAKPHQLTSSTGQVLQIEAIPSAISSCAWWILVESALLNDQLKSDIKRVQHDPNCVGLCSCDLECVQFFPTSYSHDTLFDGSDPREIFANYVRCRWPIHVFALDPVVDQQNVADQFSLRREMQLAIALAFASGEVRAQNMLRLARRLELDMETVALNRTAVAFGHGSDTFGWRFTPRVQSPDFEGNATAFFRTAFTGGPTRDQIHRQTELEPGQRECVAVVLMPNFIEHVKFEARSNYYKLGECRIDLFNRDDLRSTVKQNVAWSEQMQTIDQLLYDVECAESNRFLPNEVNRVRTRVQQLSRKLPLQSVNARVPNENTLGGFEMFSSGVTDLAPELLSYYGVPGVDPNKDTVVYLVGNNFSVHDTHVLAGNRDCQFSLISRQIMEVTIPAGVQIEEELVLDTDCKRKVVDVHISTPYGVSTHLSIPIIPQETEQSLAWESREIPLLMKYSLAPNSGSNPATLKLEIENHHVYSRGPNEILILIPPFHANPSEETFDVQVFLSASQANIPVTTFTGSDAGNEFHKLKLNSARKGYLLNGGKYGDFIKQVRDGLKTLFASLPAGQNPPELIDLEVVGQRNGRSIGGSLHIMIKLEKL